MTKPSKPYPDDLGGIRNLVNTLKKDVEDLKLKFSKPAAPWKWFWAERNWTIGASLVLLGALIAGAGGVSSLILDSHIQKAIGESTTPIHDDIKKNNDKLLEINGNVQELKGIVSVLRAQIVAERYSAVPIKDLKSHRSELKTIKEDLTQAKSTAPGYWPAAFQVIHLLSQSNVDDTNRFKSQESEFTNVTSSPPGKLSPVLRQRAVLKGHVEGLIFKECIIRFDPNVELKNDLFINCVFLLPIQENPPRPLQEIGRTLLASDLSEVTLNAS
jgi:hypothetical protein